MTDPAELAELTPLVRRAAGLDPAGVVRIRVRSGTASALVQLPFGVLVGRHVSGTFTSPQDRTYLSAELLAWLEGTTAESPSPRDEQWRVGLPPDAGWRRVETVPDAVARDLVRRGAETLKEAAEREGLPDAQPRAEVSDALLDSIVLSADHDGVRVEVSLRLLSALVRMGFLAHDSHLAIDSAGRWVRLAASYGSVYAERPGLGLGGLGRGLSGVSANPHSRIGR